MDPEILWKRKCTGLFTLKRKKPKRRNVPLPSQVEGSGGPAEKADALSSPSKKVHNDLCKTAPLEKHNVAIYIYIYTLGRFLLLLQLVQALR